MPQIILLVEDDDDVRRAVARLLALEEYQVIEAANGQIALRQMAAQSADLVIVDMLMPVMEGSETISLLRRFYPGVKIIAVSGGGISSAETHLQIARQLGAQKVLTKPFLTDDLLKAVHELTRGI